MEIEFDRVKAAENLLRHGIGFPDAAQALQDPVGVTLEDPDAVGEQRLVTIGMDALGRVLVVVYTLRAERTRLISARKASKAEAEQYARRI